MKIGKPIVFEVENQKMKVKALKKNEVLAQLWIISEEKITKIFQTGPWLSSYYRKCPNATLTKICRSKGYIIAIINGKFHFGLQSSSCFMINSLNTSRSLVLERFAV